MRHLLDAIQTSNIVQRIDTGTQPAVQTEDLVVDERGEREVIEKVGEVLPDICVSVFAQTLVVEAVHLGDLAGFVVAAEDGDALGVADFEGNEEGYSFDGVVAAVNIVT